MAPFKVSREGFYFMGLALLAPVCVGAADSTWAGVSNGGYPIGPE